MMRSERISSIDVQKKREKRNAKIKKNSLTINDERFDFKCYPLVSPDGRCRDEFEWRNNR